MPGHGDRPKHEEYARIAAGNQARVAAGEELAPLIASFQALVARQTVPEWQAVLDAVQRLPHVGAGPAGYWGVSLGCGLSAWRLPAAAADAAIARSRSRPAPAAPGGRDADRQLGNVRADEAVGGGVGREEADPGRADGR